MSNNDTTLQNLRLMRKRLCPLAKIWGPLLAGPVTVREMEGTLYLTELEKWLWISKESVTVPHDMLLSDTEVAAGTEPGELMHYLLHSARAFFDFLLGHLTKIKERPTFTTDLAAYLLAPETVIVDSIMGRIGPTPDSSPERRSGSTSKSRLLFCPPVESRKHL